MNFITPNIQMRCTRWVKDPSRERYDDEGNTHNPWKLGDTIPVVAVAVDLIDDDGGPRPSAEVLLCDALGRLHFAYLGSIPEEPDATLGPDDFDGAWPVRVEWFDPELGEWRPLP